MTRRIFATDQRPWVDAWNKEKMMEAFIERIDKKKGTGDAALQAIVAEIRPQDAPASVAFMKQVKQMAGRDLRTWSFDLRDAFRKAKDAYLRIDHGQPRSAGVYGLELAKTFEQWTSAHEVMAQARQLAERHQLDGSIDTSAAAATIEELTPTMRAFADSYDAMLRGEKTVSDFAPAATMFAFFPELEGKNLPELHEALADLISRADEGMLVGLFNHRWLKFDTSEEFRVHGPLRGDLNMFVKQLRSDAEALRNGSVFGPSRGFGRPGTDPVFSYLRSTAEDSSEGYGLIPAFLHRLASPAYQRAAFTFGDASREQLPTYGNQAPPPLTLRVEEISGGARITIG